MTVVQRYKQVLFVQQVYSAVNFLGSQGEEVSIWRHLGVTTLAMSMSMSRAMGNRRFMSGGVCFFRCFGWFFA